MVLPPSAEVIYNDLLDRIIDLRLEPGIKISENSIGEEYNVSRSVVRNVFARLSQIGFIEILPQRGTFVTKIDLKYINSILLMRLSIEKEMLYRFIEIDDKEDLLEYLRANVKEQEAYKAQGTYIDDFRKLDEEFHGIILKRGGVYDLSELLKEHLLHLCRWRNVAVNNGFRISEIVEEHKAILESIETKNFKEINKIIVMHIENTISDTNSIKEQYRSYCVNL
ncbi:MAG: GntR family transcriptional regulator [Anaerovoracaceae bacterium]